MKPWVLLGVLMLTGCTAPAQSVDTALVYVSAERAYGDDPGNQTVITREYRFGYLTDDPVHLREVVTDGTTSVHRLVPRVAAGGFPFAPLQSTFAPVDLAVLEATLDSVASGLPGPNAGTIHSFLLLRIGGTEAWVATDYGTNPVRRVTDAGTGDILGPVDGLAHGGAVSLQGPDMTMKEARDLANSSARAWRPDVALVGFTMSEQTVAGHYPFDLPEPYYPPDVLMLPDSRPGDGRAPQWTFLYHSRAVHRILPVTVYAMGIVLPGPDLAPVHPANVSRDFYGDLGAFGDYLDSPELVADAPDVQMFMWCRKTWDGGGYVYLGDGRLRQHGGYGDSVDVFTGARA